MNKISCEVIKDLLPLYADGAASEVSRVMIEEHIGSCESCRKELDRLKDTIAIPISKKETEREETFFHGIKRKLKIKKIRITVISAFTTLMITIGLYCFAVLHTWVIPYDESLVSVQYEDGSLYAEFKGDNYYGSYGYGDNTGIMINGGKKNIYVMYYEENLFSKYINPIIGKEIKDQDRWWTIFDENSDFSCDVVYYGNKADLRRTESYTEEELEDLVVLWERSASGEQ